MRRLMTVWLPALALAAAAGPAQAQEHAAPFDIGIGATGGNATQFGVNAGLAVWW